MVVLMNKLSQNLPIKILSIVIAFIIWVCVRRVVTPIVNGFVDAPIQVVNEEALEKINKSYVIKGSKFCKITYMVNSDQATMIRQSDFKVYVDLNDLFTTNDLPIYCEAQNGIDKFVGNINIEPSTLRVELDDMQRKECAVKYRTKGNIEEGHSIGSVIYSPNVVYISGSDSIIKNVSHVSIDIEVDGSAETFSGRAVPKIIDINGKEMSKAGIELSANEINYTASVFTKASVSLNTTIDGSVKNGFSYAGVEVHPNSIMIEGPRSVIENIYSLDLPSINIEGLTESKEIRYKVSDILPAGLRCSSTEEIVVNINVNDNSLGPQ